MILHLDMDAFFASVEQRDNPALRDKPVIVGRSSKRGVVAAASYEARKFGVQSAMPVFKARQRCPHGTIVPARMERYKAVSNEVMSLLGRFSPLVEQVSIDEAYLDISGCARLFGEPREVGRDIKQQIKAAVNLTCSVGIAPLKFLAKIASDMNKPDGLVMITREEMPGFIDALDIRNVPGVGQSMARQLEALDVRRLGDIKKVSETDLIKRIGQSGHRLRSYARGIDDSPVSPFHQAKSISAEHTLAEDTSNKDALKPVVLEQSERVGRQLRRQGLRAGTVILKIKTADFRLCTRRMSLKPPTQSTEVIYRKAERLLDNVKTDKKIRLVGVGASGLLPENGPVQLELFDDHRQRSANWTKVEKAVDGIVEKYGRHTIKRASMDDKKGSSEK